MLPIRYPSLARAVRIILLVTLLAGLGSRFSPHFFSPQQATTLQAASVSNLAALQVATQPDHAAGVEGWVTDQDTGAAVADAIIKLNDALQTRANAEGYFSFAAPEVAQALLRDGTSTRVQLSVSDAGHTPWSIQDVALYNGDTLRLYPRLASKGKAPTRIISALARARAQTAIWKASIDGVKGRTEEQFAYAVNSGSAPLTPPAQIRVYRTASNTVDVVSFRDYVKRTLPNEWIPTWGAESLKAGAMAVKSYAWFWISQGGKQSALGADVKDNTDDQVYDPNVSYASTDAAVDATFNYALTQNGAIFQTQYCAGEYNGDSTGVCPWSGSYMTQWGSAYYADQGKSWGWILQFYYPGAAITPQPPGGGYDGQPVPTSVAAPTRVPAPPSGTFTIGQGSTVPQLFQNAYDRNGGAQALGRPVGPVRWWLPYVSENNVVAQPFSGVNGRGNVWLVYDVLKSTLYPGMKAYILSADIGAAYATHDPAGPEWVGAPTSDPYKAGPDMGGLISQGFTQGTLAVVAKGTTVNFTAWPDKYVGWKAEYFGGQVTGATPVRDIPAQPALVRDVPAPDMNWDTAVRTPQGFGLGTEEWTAQFTRDYQLDAGSYDLVLSADSSVRLWVDNLLAVNGWQWSGPNSVTYNTDFDGGAHTIRIQFYSKGAGAQLAFKVTPKNAAQPTAVPSVPSVQPTQAAAPPQALTTASARITVRWLGRQSPPSDSWVQPLTLYLSTPGDPTIKTTVQGQTDRNGVAFYQNLPIGTFDVHVKGLHSIQSARANITLAANSTADIDMKTQVEGDVNKDNCVGVSDFAVVQSMLGASRETPGFNPAADLNNDGVVTMSDISLLRSGFDMCGDISADNQFQALSSDAAPTLAQTLSPWTSPENLQHNLALTLLPASTSVRVGQVLDLMVVAEAGTQPIDGASFLLNFDPKTLAPVNSSGTGTQNVEPALSLPAVMGNWIDAKGGAIGYAAGVLQGDLPQGRIIVARLYFRVIAADPSGKTQLTFGPAPSPLTQITNGGVNLLSNATGASVTILP